MPLIASLPFFGLESPADQLHSPDLAGRRGKLNPGTGRATTRGKSRATSLGYRARALWSTLFRLLLCSRGTPLFFLRSFVHSFVRSFVRSFVPFRSVPCFLALLGVKEKNTVFLPLPGLPALSWMGAHMRRLATPVRRCTAAGFAWRRSRELLYICVYVCARLLSLSLSRECALC